MEVLSQEYVHKHITKKQSRGWKVLCPSCGGNDLWYTDYNGRAYCFECGASYSVTDSNGKPRQYEERANEVFDVDSIRKLYGEVSVWYKESVQKSHRDYLNSRGIDSKAIDIFGIGYCPVSSLPPYTNPIARDAGLLDTRGSPSLAGRIVFPYQMDGEITDFRGRAVDKEVEPRYRSLDHRSSSRGAIFPFNYARAMEKARDDKVIIITEGEIKAAVADLFGFPCVGLPGMLAWKPGFLVNKDIRIVVAFDSNRDPLDRVRVDRALHNLSKRITDFSVVSLPLLGEDKMDIDYFLLHQRGGYSRFKYLVDNSVEYASYLKLRRF